MTHSERTTAGLLKAILDDPADDTPRLIYADWIEDQGQMERAEFIRIQCELAKSNEAVCKQTCKPPDFEGCPNRALRIREWQLLAKSYEGDLDLGICGGPWTNIGFRRGFVAELTMTVADWLQHADAILAKHPIEQVTLTTYPSLDVRSLLFQRMLGHGPLLRGATPELLGDVWPGIQFKFPPLILSDVTLTLDKSHMSDLQP